MKIVFAMLLTMLLSATVAAQPIWFKGMVGVPGVSLGPLQIGMTQTMVFNRLGMPYTIERDVSMKCAPCEDIYWVYREENSSFVVSWTLRPETHPLQTGVNFFYTDMKETTVGGVVVGRSKLRQAVERYGWWDYRRGSWYGWNAGLRFRINSEDTIDATSILERE